MFDKGNIHHAFPEMAPTMGREAGGRLREQGGSVHDMDAILSVDAVAKLLGVPRSAVWRLIADGELDAETVRLGRRLITRVQMPQPSPEEPEGPPRSRTARLQEQVDRLTHAVDRLSMMVVEQERERARAAAAQAPAQKPAPASQPEPVRVHRPPAARATPLPVAVSVPFPAGITARPNPMTHPLDGPEPAHAAIRDDLLEPVRALFKTEAGRRAWWQRLPLVVRG